MGPLVPLAALIWLAPAPVCAQVTLDPKTAAGVYEEGISKDLNPFTAESFLRDGAVMQWLRVNDPEKASLLTTQATQLKDLSDMLQAHQSDATLVDALAIRFKDKGPDGKPPYFGFGLEPARLIQWNAHWRVLASDGVLRKALLEFDTLKPEPKDFLVKDGMTADAWQKLSFEGRQAALSKWAKVVLANIRALNPKSPADVEQMRAAARQIAPLLDPSEKRLMWERVAMADTAVKSLGDLSKYSDKLNSAQLQALAEQARNGKSVEETLTALSQLYDKMGVPNKVLQAQRPTTAADKLADSDREVLEKMLGTALMAQTNGTDAGADLTAFYKNHPMKITIMALGSDLAQFRYGPKDLVFNERFIMDWAKGEGLKGRDLMTNKAAMDKLSMLLAPSFVHEARHQEQMAWANESGWRFMPGQNYEVESKSVEALFFLQKTRDPAWKKFYDDNRDSSILARSEIGIATELNKGAPQFRNTVMSDYYEGLPSLEAMAAVDMKEHDAAISFLRAELDRRKKLPQSEQDKLESSGKTYGKDQHFKDQGEWMAFAVQLKTSALEKDLQNDLSRRDNVIQSYQHNLERSDDVQLSIDQGLAKLRSGGSRNEPPAPESP